MVPISNDGCGCWSSGRTRTSKMVSSWSSRQLERQSLHPSLLPQIRVLSASPE